MYTFEMAPVYTLMEDFIIQKVGSLIGFEQQDGIMCPGGSMGNLYGLISARHKMFPNIKKEGCNNYKLCVLTSDQGH